METAKKIIVIALVGGFIYLGYRMSNAISKLIENFEGFSAVPYNDPPGSNKYSIGFGHQIQPGENLTNITRAQASVLLVKDIEKAREVIDKKITAKLTGEQYAALVSFVYNVGVGAFLNGSVDEKINSGNFQSAADTMRRYINAAGKVNQGLIARREIEASFFDVA